MLDPAGVFVVPANFEVDGVNATLSGVATSATNPLDGFVVDVTFNNLVTVAPYGSPKLELMSTAYAVNGGPVDPSTWAYYTNWSGTLTGFGTWLLRISGVDMGTGQAKVTIARKAAKVPKATIIEP